MKIKNIFRMILLAVGLLMGMNNVQAEEIVLYEGNASGYIDITADNFDNANEGDYLYVYCPKQQLYVATLKWEALYYTPYNDWIRNGEYYSDANSRFELEITADILTKLKSDGLHLQDYSNAITKATLESSSAPAVQKYKITYTFEGNVLKTEKLAAGATPTPPSAPTKTGYTFTGWENLPETMPASDVTVTAQMTPNLHTITYYINNVLYDTQQVAYGTTIVPITPVQEGYIFKGWNYYPETMPDNDISIYGASSKIYSLNLVYDKTKGTVTATKTTEIELNEQINVTVTPEKGYEIESVIFRNSDGSTPNSWNSYTVQFGSYDITCTVTFSKAAAEKHTLTISIDGETTTKQVAEGNALSSVLPTPTKTGYTFTGWEGLPSDGNMPANDLTVTAQFSINSYKLTYKVDGEVYGDVETIEYGAAITPRTAPTKEGYAFSGWSYIPGTMPANDVEVTGSFEKDKVYTQLSVGTTGYSTFCSDKALKFKGSEAVKAYVAKTKSATEVTLAQVTGTVAPGTGLLLIGNSNATANIEVVESGNSYSDNLLVGTTSETIINAANLYVLVNKNGTIKFADTAAQAATVPAGKAYLQTPASSSRMLTICFDDNTTAIETIQTDKAVSEVYNLSGQRIKALSKGLYIINGKKVVIK